MLLMLYTSKPVPLVPIYTVLIRGEVIELITIIYVVFTRAGCCCI